MSMEAKKRQTLATLKPLVPAVEGRDFAVNPLKKGVALNQTTTHWRASRPGVGHEVVDMA